LCVKERGRTTLKRRVLIVDDDEVVRESFRQILVNEGYGVDVAETGIQALDRIKVGSFNLIVVNNRLPNMSGKELKNKILKNIPSQRIILLGSRIYDSVKLLNLIKEDK
jgi:DNA-binding response OmpR family regulator